MKKGEKWLKIFHEAREAFKISGGGDLFEVKNPYLNDEEWKKEAWEMGWDSLGVVNVDASKKDFQSPEENPCADIDKFIPTNKLRWVKVREFDEKDEETTVIVHGYTYISTIYHAPYYYKLQQYWKSPDGRGEWRNVEIERR